jgi:hypothetical protein
MPPRGSTTNVTNPIRLPPLPRLKVRRPNRHAVNPCIGIMQSMLGCWASAGKNSAVNCIALEQQLRACMDTKVRPLLSRRNRADTRHRERRRRRRAPSTTTCRGCIPRSLARERGTEPPRIANFLALKMDGVPVQTTYGRWDQVSAYGSALCGIGSCPREQVYGGVS